MAVRLPCRVSVLGNLFPESTSISVDHYRGFISRAMFKCLFQARHSTAIHVFSPYMRIVSVGYLLPFGFLSSTIWPNLHFTKQIFISVNPRLFVFYILIYIFCFLNELTESTNEWNMFHRHNSLRFEPRIETCEPQCCNKKPKRLQSKRRHSWLDNFHIHK